MKFSNQEKPLDEEDQGLDDTDETEDRDETKQKLRIESLYWKVVAMLR